MTTPPLSFGLENMRWVETLPKIETELNFKVIEGLDVAVQSMYKNELAIISIKVNNRSLDIIQSQLRTLKKIYLQPPLAYGDLGRKPDIPPDSRITYLFGLLHFEKQKEMAEMTWAQVIKDWI